MATEIVVQRSKWAASKLLIGGVAVAVMFILITVIASLPFAIRASTCLLSLVFSVIAFAATFRLASGLPACVIRDDGILVPRFGISRHLSPIPWTMVRDAALIDLAPASAPIGQESAFGEPAIRLTLAKRFSLSNSYMILVGDANLAPEKIYTHILARKAASLAAPLAMHEVR